MKKVSLSANSIEYKVFFVEGKKETLVDNKNLKTWHEFANVHDYRNKNGY